MRSMLLDGCQPNFLKLYHVTLHSVLATARGRNLGTCHGDWTGLLEKENFHPMSGHRTSKVFYPIRDVLGERQSQTRNIPCRFLFCRLLFLGCCTYPDVPEKRREGLVYHAKEAALHQKQKQRTCGDTTTHPRGDRRETPRQEQNSKAGLLVSSGCDADSLIIFLSLFWAQEFMRTERPSACVIRRWRPSLDMR